MVPIIYTKIPKITIFLHLNATTISSSPITLAIKVDSYTTIPPKVVFLATSFTTPTKILNNQPCHPMITRAKLGHLLAQRKFSLLTKTVLKEPTNVVEALSNPLWFQAMQVEFEALVKNNS